MTSSARRLIGLTLGLLILGGPSCSSHTPGVEIEVAYQSSDTPAFYTTDLGYYVELDRVLVNFSEVSLIECEETSWLAPLLGASALAHSEGSPTRLGEPRVIDFVEALGFPQHAGLILPPPGDYCALEVRLSPADEDAAGLPSDIDFVGRSLRIEGLLLPAGGAPRRFVVESADDLSIRLPFEAPLTLDLEHPNHAFVVMTHHLEWLEGIDFDSASEAEQATAALLNLSSLLETQHMTETP